MKVYDITKTIELTDYDLKFGYLKEDTIITHFPEIQAVEEKSHIVVVQEYPNGGKDELNISLHTMRSKIFSFMSHILWNSLKT